MMNKRLFFSSIERKILATTLLPLLLITLALGGYFISNQLNAASSALYERGNTLTTLLSRSAEFALLVNDKEQLSKLLSYSVETEDISDIVFLDKDYQVLVRANPNGPSVDGYEGYNIVSENRAIFVAPVYTSGIDISDTPEQISAPDQQEVIGWVAVILSKRPTLNLQSELLIEGVFIALGFFSITLFLALRLGKNISSPMLELTRVVKQLEQGQLDSRIKTNKKDEFAVLSRGINELAANVQKAQEGYTSEINQATFKLREALGRLEQKNAALDSALNQSALASRAKDDFLARMSHELRTPLTSVIGFARLLHNSQLSSDQSEYVRIINQASSLLLAVIDDILDYSKLESNAVKLESIELDLLSLIHDVIDMQSPQAHKKQLDLCAIIDPQTPKTIIGDPVRLRQILINLIGNSIKFTQSGHIVISVHPRIQDNSELIIRVEDTGIGISKTQIKNLFSAFSQADNSITRRFGGSGLGLAISRRLTELMEGVFSLNSHENQGTQVRLNLPLKTPEAPHLNHPLFPLALGQVVIYDPLPLNRRSLRYQLNQLTPRAYSATSISDMISFTRENSVDYLIWGVSPKSSIQAQGDALKKLREGYKGRIIWLHGHTDQPLLDENATALLKPTRPSRLLEALTPCPLRQANHSIHQTNSIVSGAKRVLIAEDNNFNRVLIEKTIKQFGILCKAVTNGADAVTSATDEHFDAVIMDVHMPIMDGIEASHQLHIRKPCLPIIALTANVMPEEHQRLREAGVYKILTKPINDTQLKATLSDVLNNDIKAQVSELGDQSTLRRLDISQEQLNEELNSQLSNLRKGVMTSDYALIRSHTHQLLGVAGFYELPELEAIAYKLQDAAHQQNLRKVWKYVWRLQRIAASF